MSDERRESLLARLVRWHGLLTHATRGARIAGITALSIACVAMVATQLNYVVVGDAHMIVVLAPITACALLYGAVPATAVGATAGLAELIHATLLPLDYYEKYFTVPWNSVVLFALVGFVMGLLFAHADQYRGQSGWRRPAGIVVCCAIGSAVFTLFFHQSTYLINSLLALELPTEFLKQLTGSHEVFSQWLADFGLMVMLAFVTDHIAVKLDQRSENLTIRATFQGWLAVVVVIAYMTCAALAYTGISIVCRGDAEQRMGEQIVYLEGQLAERDKMLEGVARRSQVTQRVLDEVHDSSIASVTTNLTLGDDGVNVVAENGIVVSSNRESFVGLPFEEVVGAGMQNGFDEALYGAARSSEWDMGGGVLGYMRAATMGYARVAKTGDYQLMVAMSAADVFAYRGVLMGVVSAVFVAIFFVVYTQAALLLQNVVVKGFDETNEALSGIMEGDLNRSVEVHDSVEFTHLSNGINATVGALKNSIAETRARIERELRTAQAIQHSALPSTFPPFPDIDRFDIYASMDTAREVGGDFYDFFLIDDHTLGFLIADVSGKGIPAALFMMAAKTEVGNYMASGMDLAQAVQSANYHLCQGNDAGMFVTVWAATLDYNTGKLTYVNAGHNPPLLRHNGSWQWLRKRGGLFLGSFDLAKYRSETVYLERGDQLLLYTDGVTEAFSPNEEQYGEQRLERYLYQHASDHPHALVDGLRADVAAWANGAEQSDDITLLSMEFGVAPEVTGTITVPAKVDQLERVLQFIHEELGKRLCPIAVQNQMDIALEELFVNVCNYAYADKDEPGTCTVDYVYNANPHAMTIQLSDQGVPFDPLEHGDPSLPTSIEDAQVGGLGIYMTRRLVDDLSYVRDGDTNIVAFHKTW